MNNPQFAASRQYARIGLRVVTVLALVLLGSCRSTRSATEVETVRKLTARQIINNYRGVPGNLNTLSGKVKVEYVEDGKVSSTTLTFRMQRDSVIWLSAPLGMVKALITPSRIQFYNRLENTFFEGDFQYVKDLAGVDLDFQLLEDLLLGESMVNLNEGKYNAEVIGGQYALMPKEGYQGFDVAVLLDPQSFRVSRQIVTDPVTSDSLRVYYRYDEDPRGIPGQLKLEVEYEQKDREITIEYRNLEKNRSLTFPYRVPRGFRRIEVKP